MILDRSLRLLPLLLVLNAIQSQEQSLDTITPIQGKDEQGKVHTIDKDGNVAVTVGGKKSTRSLSDLRRVDLPAKGVAPVPRQGLLLLRSGMNIPAAMREANARSLQFTSPLFEGRTTIGLSQIQAVRFARLAVEDDGGFAKYFKNPKEEKDLIYFKTSEKIVQRSVRVIGFEDGKVQYDTRGAVKERRITSLYGIVMAQGSGFAPDPLPRPRVRLGMQGGSTLVGKLLSLDADTATLQLAEKATLKVFRNRLRRIVVESDRLVFLTELEPKVHQVAAFRAKKPWMKNRSPMGEGIQLGGENPRTLANGLVLPPKTSLTYDIKGSFDFFVATIAIDARSTGPAHAVFRVLDGDKVLFESKPVTKDTEPQKIRVPVSKVKQLTIQADFGKNFDFGDHCVFAEARVIKQGS